MAPELVQALRPHINSRSITLPHGGPKDDDGCEDAPNVYSERSFQGAYDRHLSGSTRRLTQIRFHALLVDGSGHAAQHARRPGEPCIQLEIE